MKNVGYLITLFLFCFFAGNCSAQKEEKKSLVIINDIFFEVKPEPFPCGKPIQIGNLHDSILGKISITKYEGMSEEAKQLAIPTDKVEKGEAILQAAQQVRLLTVIPQCPSIQYAVGDVFPDFSLRDIQGKNWTNEQLKGKKTVINFWFTGCGPCRNEMPELGRWVKQFPEVTLLAITFQKTEQIQQLVAEQHFYFHQLVEGGELIKELGIQSYPTTFVLDENNRIERIEIGTTPLQRRNILKHIQ